MKPAVIAALVAAFAIFPLSGSLRAQTACGENCGLPGGHPHNDYQKPTNGDHGNNGGNGG